MIEVMKNTDVKNAGILLKTLLILTSRFFIDLERIICWDTIEDLADFKFEIFYRPGKDNTIADLLLQHQMIEVMKNTDVKNAGILLKILLILTSRFFIDLERITQ